jgi:hypothetical protein
MLTGKTIALTEVDSAGRMFRVLMPLDIIRQTKFSEWSSKDDTYPGACSLFQYLPSGNTMPVKETLTDIEEMLTDGVTCTA